MKIPYLSIKQIFLLLVTAALIFGLTPAIHAGGLSGLKDSLNKGEIDSTTIEQTKQQSDISDVPRNSTVTNKTTTKFQNFIKSAHKMNILQKSNISKQLKVQPFNSPKDIEKYITKIKTSTVFKKECNLKKRALKDALLKFLKKPKNKLKRIGEKTLPVKLEAEQSKAAKIWISPLPSSFPPETKDTTELEAIGDVKALHQIINDPEFYNDSFTNMITKMVQIESLISQASVAYSKFPYICAMLKFYCTEMRVNILGYFDASYTAEKKFAQIYETYYANRSDNECCREILDLALNRKHAMVLFINNEMSKRINEADTYINDVNNYINVMKDTIYSSENDAPTKDWIETVYSENISSYDTIISSNLQKGEYEEAKRKLLEMEKYYSETPSKFKVKYWEEVFNPVTQQYVKVEQSKTYDIKKRTQRYFAAIKSYVSNGGNYSEIDEESSEKVLKDINSYIDKVKAYVPSDNEECSPETLKYFQEQIDNKFSSSETSDHYYSQNRNITKMYFTRTENIELDSQDIPNPKDNLALRCVTDSKGPLYPFKQDVVSTISVSANGTDKRIKTLKLKKDWFDKGNYYAVFQPNETDDPKDAIKNLINNEADAFKESIALIRADGGAPSMWSIYQNSYFKNKSGFGAFDNTAVDFKNMIFKLSYDFFQAGGVECLQAEYDGVISAMFVKNQADWIVFYGHGNPDTGSIGMEYTKENPDQNAIIVTPGKDKIVFDEILNKYVNVPGLIREDGTSRYDEDVDVLMLTACGVLNNGANIRAWHNVLPKGIILGYNVDVSNYVGDDIFAAYNELLKKNVGTTLSHEEIGNKWCEYNRKISDNYGMFALASKYYAAFYTFIYDDLCYKGGKKETKKWGRTEETEDYEGIIFLK